MQKYAIVCVMGRYEPLYQEAVCELERGAQRHVSLQLLCNLLYREVSYYHWCGFYFALPDEDLLVLGPFEGAPTEHVRIPFGTGICGLAAERRETVLACNARGKSEIVVPVFRGERVIAGIDIDSHRENAFDREDQAFLERLAMVIAPYVPDIPPMDDRKRNR